MQKKGNVRKVKSMTGLPAILSLIPNYPNWISSKEMAVSLNTSTSKIYDWVKSIPVETPVAVNDLSKGFQKYCYIRDSSGRILI